MIKPKFEGRILIVDLKEPVSRKIKVYPFDGWHRFDQEEGVTH